MQLPALLQAPTGCAGCLLNRRQGGHSRCARCGVEKNLLPLPGIKPQTVTRVAAIDATITALLDISIKPNGGVRTRKRWGDREQGWRIGCRKQLNVPCDTPAHQLHSRQNIAALFCVHDRSPRCCCRSNPSNDCVYRIYSELM